MKLTFAPWGETMDELLAMCVKAEDAGFADVWVPELHRSATIPCAAIAAATKTVGVGTAIALAFTRSPMITALEAMDIDEIAEGRFILGLGTGVQRLNEDWHNARFGKPAPHIRETVEIIRRVVAESHLGEEIVFEGEWERIRLRGYERPFKPVRERIPVYLAAVGDYMTRLTGRIADGWIAHELGSPAYLKERILPNLHLGLEKAGRDRSELDVVASACCVIDTDSRAAKRKAAGLVAFYASVRTYEDFFDFHGFLNEAREVQQAFRARDEQALVDAVPDAMVDALTISGTIDEVRARLKEYEGLADKIKLSPPTHFVPVEVTRDAQNGILEWLS